MLNSIKILDNFGPKIWEISDQNFGSKTLVWGEKCSDARKVLDEMLPKFWKNSDQNIDSFSGDENVFLYVSLLELFLIFVVELDQNFRRFRTKILGALRPRFPSEQKFTDEGETHVFAGKLSDARKILDEMQPKFWEISYRKFGRKSSKILVELNIKNKKQF